VGIFPSLTVSIGERTGCGAYTTSRRLRGEIKIGHHFRAVVIGRWSQAYAISGRQHAREREKVPVHGLTAGVTVLPRQSIETERASPQVLREALDAHDSEDQAGWVTEPEFHEASQVADRDVEVLRQFFLRATPPLALPDRLEELDYPSIADGHRDEALAIAPRMPRQGAGRPRKFRSAAIRGGDVIGAGSCRHGPSRAGVARGAIAWREQEQGPCRPFRPDPAPVNR
jgi:hypothetical protein